MNWSDFGGSDPLYLAPYNLTFPVADQVTWDTGGLARWPMGAGAQTGSVLVAGSDDLAHYDPDRDILVFGFRTASGAVREMSARDYTVLFEEVIEGLWNLKVMPLSGAAAGDPVAVVTGLPQDDLPQIVESWVPTDTAFQHDLTAAIFAIDQGSRLPAPHMAVLTHEEGAVTRYDYAALKDVHGDAVVLNFTTMTGRALRATYDADDQTLRIDHFAIDRPDFNDVWGSTLIENITPAQLVGLRQLWRRDAVVEDGQSLRNRFDEMIADLVAQDLVAQSDGDEGIAQTGAFDHPDPSEDDVTQQPDEPTVSLAGATMAAETGQAKFDLILSDRVDHDVTAVVQALIGSAENPDDLVAVGGVSVVIPAGRLSAQVSVELADNGDDAPTGLFAFDIIQVEGALVGTARAEAIRVGSDPGIPPAPASDPQDEHAPELNDGPTSQAPPQSTATFLVELDAPFETSVTLTYRTEDVTSTAGRDYQAQSGTLVFAPGETRKEVILPLHPTDEARGEDTYLFIVEGGADGPVEVATKLQDDDDTLMAQREPETQSPVAEFKVRTDWGDGATVELVLTNTTGRDIEGWEIDFDLPVGISEYWSARIFDDGNARYTAENLGWNGRVPAGESVVIGFNTLEGQLDEEQLNRQADFTFDFI